MSIFLLTPTAHDMAGNWWVDGPLRYVEAKDIREVERYAATCKSHKYTISELVIEDISVPEPLVYHPCPKCGVEMVKRMNHKTRKTFYGCPKFPKCRGVSQMRNRYKFSTYTDMDPDIAGEFGDMTCQEF